MPSRARLATGSGWVNYLQWNSTGSGSLTADTLTGTPPAEQVASNQTPITVSVNGSEVTFSGLKYDNGTLSDGTLTLQVLNSDGTLGTDQFTPATQDQFNQAALQLSNQAGSDNSAAVQASAAAASAAANAAAEQTASNDLATVQGVGFSSDLSSLNSEVTQVGKDLDTAKSDAGNGQGQDCGNANTVEGDFNTVTGDANSASGAVGQLSSDISTARQNIGTLQADLSNLQNTGLPAPSGAAAAITSAQGTISSAISTANGDIGQVNGDVTDAAQVLGSLATGSCANIGIPYSPSPMPTVS